MVTGAVRIGVTVDETFHVIRLNNFLDHGWYLLDDDLDRSGEPGSWVADRFVYAPFSTLFLHALNVLLGNDSWGHVAMSSEAYVVRHLGVAFLGLAGVIATASMTRLLSHSWRWGAVSGAVLLMLPMWLGHSMFNVKDVPVGAGYTFVTLGCMLVMTIPQDRHMARVSSSVLLLMGFLLAIGTRPAMWPGLLVPVLCVVSMSLLRSGRGSPAHWWRARDVVISALAALTVLALVYPVVFMHPAEWLMGSATESADYHGRRTRTYIPMAIASSVPVLLLVLGLVGSWTRLRAWVSQPRIGGRQVLWALVLSQALLLPCMLVVRTAALSGGLRHVLFAAPAVAVLITAGLAQVLSDIRGERSRQSVTALGGVALLVPLVTQVQLFPYSYAYANPLPDAVGTPWPGDFWQASFREYADEVPPDAFVVCDPALDDQARALRQKPNGGQSWLDVSQDCSRVGPLSVLQPYLQKRAPRHTVSPEFVALVVRVTPQPRGCSEIAKVERTRLLTDTIVSRAYVCPLVLLPYEGAIDLDGAGAGAEFLMGGWSGNGGEKEIIAADRASLGFARERSGETFMIDVTGSSAGDVGFLVNNESVTATKVSSGWRLRVPPQFASLGGEENLVITVVPQDEVRLSRVEVVEDAR